MEVSFVEFFLGFPGEGDFELGLDGAVGVLVLGKQNRVHNLRKQLDHVVVLRQLCLFTNVDGDVNVDLLKLKSY